MPNKTTTDNNYRYNFQGQEKDPETGMEAFELRLWDGRLGRWLTVDPMGQYASPYLGMGNNPVNMIDPDGGFAEGGGDPPGSWLGRLWGSVTSGISNLLGRPVNPSDYTPSEYMIETVVIQREFKKVIQNTSFMILGAGNSFASNMLLNNKMRMNPNGHENELAIRTGMLVGDVASMFTGSQITTYGGTTAIAGALATPETGPIGAAIAVEGAAVAVYGTVVTTNGVLNTAEGIQGLTNYFASNKHSSNGGGSGNFKKLSSNKDANEYSQSKGYNDAHDLKASHVGKGNESKFDIEVDGVTGEGRLISKDGKKIVPIY